MTRGRVAPLAKHQQFQMIPKVSLPSNHKHGQCANFGLMAAVFWGFGKLGS